MDNRGVLTSRYGSFVDMIHVKKLLLKLSKRVSKCSWNIDYHIG